MTKSEVITDLLKFIELLDESSDTCEFSMNCAAQGLADWATQEFFDTYVFRVLTSYGIPRSELKYKLMLKQRLVKLNEVYQDLVDKL